MIEHNLQPGDVRALGLREFVDVAFGKINWVIAFHVEREAVTLLEAAQCVDALGAEQFAQQVHHARAADSLSRAVTDDLGTC